MRNSSCFRRRAGAISSTTQASTGTPRSPHSFRRFGVVADDEPVVVIVSVVEPLPVTVCGLRLHAAPWGSVEQAKDVLSFALPVAVTVSV